MAESRGGEGFGEEIQGFQEVDAHRWLRRRGAADLVEGHADEVAVVRLLDEDYPGTARS